MNKAERWLVMATTLLLVAPCMFILQELTAAPEPSSRGASARAAASRAGSGAARADLASVDAGALPGGRARSVADSGQVARTGAGAGSSRAVYAFSRTAGGASAGDGKIADPSYRNSDPRFGRSGQGFDPRDLAVLAEIIRLNDLDEDSSSQDYDDGDGVLEPTEVGTQIWCGSRLRVLQMGPSSFSSFGYELRELPDTLSNLDFLTVLESNGTGLEELPATLGELQDLQRVSAFGNRLKAIPPELAGAPELQELQLGNNQISKIPDTLQKKAGLKGVFVEGNPIQKLPRMLVKQNEKMMRGELVVPAREIGRFGPDCRPVS